MQVFVRELELRVHHLRLVIHHWHAVNDPDADERHDVSVADMGRWSTLHIQSPCLSEMIQYLACGWTAVNQAIAAQDYTLMDGQPCIDHCAYYPVIGMVIGRLVGIAAKIPVNTETNVIVAEVRADNNTAGQQGTAERGSHSRNDDGIRPYVIDNLADGDGHVDLTTPCHHNQYLTVTPKAQKPAI